MILDKGVAYAKTSKLDLVNARLAPDMFTLAQQVELACDHARDRVARLTGKNPPRSRTMTRASTVYKDCIANAVEYLKLSG